MGYCKHARTLRVAYRTSTIRLERLVDSANNSSWGSYGVSSGSSSKCRGRNISRVGSIATLDVLWVFYSQMWVAKGFSLICYLTKIKLTKPTDKTKYFSFLTMWKYTGFMNIDFMGLRYYHKHCITAMVKLNNRTFSLAQNLPPNL